MSILITGGSGFLGHGLVGQLLKGDDERICIYSRGEHSQAVMREKFPDPDGRLRWMIGDVRDESRLRWAMNGIDVVIAAAALKRIEVGVYAPSEMVLTNVFGAMSTINAAAYCGVKKVIGISSDKAYNARSPYGQSKAMSEALYLSAGTERPGPIYSAVRYGNIWGSTGSIGPKWQRLMAEGATHVPVTAPSCTRFFMKIEEAVKLILDTEKTMTGGELVIPESLPAYQLRDLADAFGAKMTITGLPKWEKEHEGLRDGLTSDHARRMTVDELRAIL